MDGTEIISKATADIANNPTPGLVGVTISERYHVLGELGSGGMSTVYRARQVHLDRIFALKVLHESSELAVQRFLVEGQASTLLQHPNIVTVHDFGLHEGRAFMVLDYIEGQSLEDLITAEGALEPMRAIRIFGQICSALAHAHEQGVIHRDIKPSNIIISNVSPNHERVVVLDFGIAKILRPSDTAEAQNLTRTGEVFGTPLYMSPEQCEGRAVDARADIYSLGCVMYETLTGNPPFEGYNFFNTIYKQIKEAPPPFPSALRKTPRGMLLECIVLKSMAKSPQNRQKFMLELSSELKQVELGTTSTVGNFFSSLKLMTGRLNAIERSRFLLGSTMQALTAIALVMSLLLFFLPGRIASVVQEGRRNHAIIQVVNYFIKQRFDTNSILSMERDELDSVLGWIQRLCDKDRDQRLLSEKICTGAELALVQSQRVPYFFSQVLISPDEKITNHLKKSLNQAVKSWTHTLKHALDLVALSYNNQIRLRDILKILLGLFEFSKWGGIVVEFLLLGVMIESFQNLKRKTVVTPEPK